MVLPAPAPDDAPRPHEPAWLERLKVILRLADRGVIVLLDGAQPPRLGELIRSLSGPYPDVEVYADARRLASAAKGAVVVLVPDAAQADWLNLERPVVAHRELRLVLFSSAETSARLARQAVDFFHWISHRIECPPGPVVPAVRTIRRALCARARGIAWSGGDLEAAMSAALPGRSLSIVPATLPYEELVEAARPRGRGWVGFSGVESPFWLRRVRWALAEAGRRGRAILVEASASASVFWPAHGRLMSLAEAVKALEAAGAVHAGRLGALLELEPAAVRVAGRLLQGGVAESVIEDVAKGAEDPGAEVATIAIARGMKRAKMSPVMLRAAGQLPRAAPQNRFERSWTRSERVLRAGRSSKPDDFSLLAVLASVLGDPELAERWAHRWLDGGMNRAGALYFVGLARFYRGELGPALETFQEAVGLCKRAPDDRLLEHALALGGLGRVLHARANLPDAERALRRAFALIQKAQPPRHAQCVEILAALIDVLVDEGRFDEALQLGVQAYAMVDAANLNPYSTWGLSHSYGRLSIAVGDFKLAEQVLHEALAAVEQKSGKQDPAHAILLGDIGNLYIARRQFQDAEVVLTRAVAVSDKLGRRPSWRLVEPLANALIEQGKYVQVDRLLRRTVAEAEHSEEWASLAGALFGLGNSSMSRGRIREAESFYRRALDMTAKTSGKDSPYYAPSLHGVARVLLGRGEIAEADAMLREVQSIHEKTLGREHPVLGGVLRDLAEIDTQRDRLVDAERLLRRALLLADRSADKNEAPATLKQLSLLQAQMGRRDAVDTARRALRKLAENAGVSDDVIADREPELAAIVRK